MYPLPTLLTPLPLMALTLEEITSCTNEGAKGAFTASVTPSINTLNDFMTWSSKDFMILIILLTSSFKINKVNLFPALTAPFPLVFFQIYLLHLNLNWLLIQENYV